jgi:hypothetical protein
MDNFGLVDAIRTYCETEGHHFFYGQDGYINIEQDAVKFETDELIVICDFNCVPTYTSGVIAELRYVGTFGVGRKREAETESTMDETPIQKWDNRLKDLCNSMTDILADLACENELEVVNVNIRFDLFKFDAVADYVIASLTFVQ